MEFEIKMLSLGNGKCPFEEWYISIPDKVARARIRSRLTRIRRANFGDCKGLGEGVQELRLDFGPGYRLYFAMVGQVMVVLLGGDDKSSQARDIAIAIERWKENGDATERLQRDF